LPKDTSQVKIFTTLIPAIISSIFLHLSSVSLAVLSLKETQNATRELVSNDVICKEEGMTCWKTKRKGEKTMEKEGREQRAEISCPLHLPITGAHGRVTHKPRMRTRLELILGQFL